MTDEQQLPELQHCIRITYPSSDRKMRYITIDVGSMEIADTIVALFNKHVNTPMMVFKTVTKTITPENKQEGETK